MNAYKFLTYLDIMGEVVSDTNDDDNQPTKLASIDELRSLMSSNRNF